MEAIIAVLLGLSVYLTACLFSHFENNDSKWVQGEGAILLFSLLFAPGIMLPDLSFLLKASVFVGGILLWIATLFISLKATDVIGKLAIVLAPMAFTAAIVCWICYLHYVVNA